MSKHSLRIGLFDRGMTHLHRVGLAGLYMTLSNLDPDDFAEVGGWRLDARSVEFQWKESPRSLLETVIKQAFGIKEGLIDFLAHRTHPMEDLARFLLHNALLKTYLQHGQTRKSEKTSKKISMLFDNKTVVQEIRPLTKYANQEVEKLKLFGRSGSFQNKVKLAGWLSPGGTVRHVAYTSNTALYANPAEFLCLLFAPVASLYFLVSHRNPDGKYDKRKGAAIVLPHIKDLAVYHRCYTRYLSSPVHMLYADSLGDAGLMALTALHAFAPGGMVNELDVDSCTVLTMGTVGWSKQQKTRTGLMRLAGIDRSRLNIFSLALRSLVSTPHVNENGTFYVRTSLCRGLIADNIALNRDWHEGFYRLMCSKQLARIVSFERRGLSEMVENVMWSYESDKLFVESIHRALRNRYGALASRAKQKGEPARFDREFERIRSSLMRAKNGQTLRAELADIFARGGINRSLQEHWPDLLPLFTGPGWQKARDLALLALASYSGQGIEEIESETFEEKEVE